MKLDDDIHEIILKSTSAERVEHIAKVQSLWSGYGQIYRVHLVGGCANSVIVKHVNPPSESSHPRGWNGVQSHQRKLRSYEVESNWYANYSKACGTLDRVPRCWATQSRDGKFLFVLEDLDAAGYSRRRGRLDRAGVCLGLDWLAHFHARFLGIQPKGLWSIGTYWHLATRPDELSAMASGPLKDAAQAIDARLNQCQHQTFVHGDAKVANFCFSERSTEVAVVDFQYVGGGCGMKDVAYFLGSCLDELECEAGESAFLDHYFATFRGAVAKLRATSAVDAIEREWRALYPFAWADFTRFMLGWCPNHGKLNAYSRRLTDQVIRYLKA